MKKLDQSRYYQRYLYIGYVWVIIVCIMFFLTNCATIQTVEETTEKQVETIKDQPNRSEPVKPKKILRCELMAEGKKCLSDHSCCKK